MNSNAFHRYLCLSSTYSLKNTNDCPAYSGKKCRFGLACMGMMSSSRSSPFENMVMETSGTAVLQICFCSIAGLFLQYCRSVSAVLQVCFSASQPRVMNECCRRILAKIDKTRLILYLRIVPLIVSVFQLHKLATCRTIMSAMPSSS